MKIKGKEIIHVNTKYEWSSKKEKIIKPVYNFPVIAVKIFNIIGEGNNDNNY